MDRSHPLPAGGLGQSFSPRGSVVTDRDTPWQVGKLFFLRFGSHNDGVRITVKGPALLDFQGYGVNNGATFTPGALHSFRYFAVPATSNTPLVVGAARVQGPLVNQGPYLYLPQGGDYVVFCDDNIDSNITGVPNPDTAGFFFVVTEYFTPDIATILMNQSPRVQRTIQVAHNCVNAVSTHLLPPSPSSGFGQQQDGHVCGVILQSNSATLRTIFLAFGRDAVAADFSLAPLSIAQGINYYPLGCGDSVNIFNSGASPTVVSAVWMFQ